MGLPPGVSEVHVYLPLYKSYPPPREIEQEGKVLKGDIERGEK